MATDYKISELSVAESLDGSEQIPFEKDGVNGAVSASELINGYGMPMVLQSEAAVTIEPDVLNVWGVMAALAVDFAPCREGYAGEYCLEFTSGEPATVLSLPASVQFPDESIIEPNMRYQISVVDNFGLIAGVEI